DHRLVGCGELRAEGGAQAPAEAAGGGVAEVAARPGDRHLLEDDRIFVDDERALVEQLVDACREPLSRDARGQRVGAGTRLLTRRLAQLGDALAPCLDLLDRRRLLLRAAPQRLERRGERAGEGEVGAEAAQRIA